MVQKRKNTFEIFGFDFMIDENYNPWIIEINQSPAMDYSTVIKSLFSILYIFLIKANNWEVGSDVFGRRAEGGAGLWHG